MTLKLAYFGHIMRGSGSPLTLQIVEGMVEGKRKRGRQKKQWFDNIREWTGLSYTQGNYATVGSAIVAFAIVGRGG